MKTNLKAEADALWQKCRDALDAYNKKARRLPQFYSKEKGYPINDICSRFGWIAKIDGEWVAVDKFDGTQYQLTTLALEWLCEFIDKMNKSKEEKI